VSLLAGNPGGHATIRFVDDGVGFKETGNSKRRGLGLVRRLMEQVEGSAEVRSDVGTAWTLTFPMPTHSVEHETATAAE
jgi:two-component sensor histidine kinase